MTFIFLNFTLLFYHRVAVVLIVAATIVVITWRLVVSALDQGTVGVGATCWHQAVVFFCFHKKSWFASTSVLILI